MLREKREKDRTDKMVTYEGERRKVTMMLEEWALPFPSVPLGSVSFRVSGYARQCGSGLSNGSDRSWTTEIACPSETPKKRWQSQAREEPPHIHK